VITDPASLRRVLEQRSPKSRRKRLTRRQRAKSWKGKLDVLDLSGKGGDGYRKGKITDDELDTQKAAIWIEECEVKRELATKRLLVGGRPNVYSCGNGLPRATC